MKYNLIFSPQSIADLEVGNTIQVYILSAYGHYSDK